MVSVWGTLSLSPELKKSVVASLEEDAPFRAKVALSSCTENAPDVASRNPKTVTAVPSGVDGKSEQNQNRG